MIITFCNTVEAHQFLLSLLYQFQHIIFYQLSCGFVRVTVYQRIYFCFDVKLMFSLRLPITVVAKKTSGYMYVFVQQ